MQPLFLCVQDGLSPLNLYIEDEFHRATRGGVGGVKSITNYAPVSKYFCHINVKKSLNFFKT